jgi:hypothetical protein
MGDFNTASFYGDEATDLRGPAGDQGDKGDQGGPGPRGEPGKDAYQVWLALGNAGTEADFIASLTGPRGPKGDRGDTGQAGSDATYRFGGFAIATIASGEVLMDHVVVEAHTLPQNLSGSIASCGQPPSSTWVGTVLKNGAPIGSLTVTTAGACTFTSSQALQALPGDIIALVGPDTADEAIGRLRWTFRGEKL